MNNAAADFVPETATAASLALPLLAALALTIILSLLLIPLARRIGWTDKPDARKQHKGEIPLVGGAAILGAILLIDWFWMPYGPTARGLMGAMVLMFVIGIIDDVFPVRARYRFIAQFVAAALIVFVDRAVVLGLGDCCLGGMSELELLAVPFTLVAIVGLINAFNMSDGLDGLCGGYGLIAAAWLGVALLSSPSHTLGGLITEVGPVLAPLVGALIGFLLLNGRFPWQPRALIFLGDSGSMLLGCAIGWVAITLSQPYDGLHLPPTSVAWIVAMPVLDMVSCIARRVNEGRTPMSADRRHLHHLLVARGQSPESAVITLHGLSCCGGIVGVVGWRLGMPETLSFALLTLLFLFAIVYTLRFWHRIDLEAAQERLQVSGASPEGPCLGTTNRSQGAPPFPDARS